MDEHKLRQMLLEDLGAEAEDFLPLVQSLRALPLPEPRQAILTTPARYPLQFLCAQIRLMGYEIGLASALVLLLGVLITLGNGQSTSVQALPFSVLAPIVAAVGVALLYDGEQETAFEIEAASQTRLSTLILARMTLIFAFDLGLSLLGSLILAALNSHLTLQDLILAWLVPMTFLSGLAFFLTIYTRNAWFGMSVSLSLWVLHVIFRAQTSPDLLGQILAFQGFSDPATRPILLGMAVLLVIIGVMLASQPERRLGVGV